MLPFGPRVGAPAVAGIAQRRHHVLRQAEVVGERVEVLRREPFPAAADVGLPVLDGRESGVAARVEARQLRAARISVVDRAEVEAEVAPGVFPSAVEVHLDACAVRILVPAHVGVPVAEIEAARMRVVDPALDRRPDDEEAFAEGLRDAAEPVVADDRHVPGDGVLRRSGRCGRCLRDGDHRCADRDGGCGGEQQFPHDEWAPLVTMRKAATVEHFTCQKQCCLKTAAWCLRAGEGTTRRTMIGRSWDRGH